MVRVSPTPTTAATSRSSSSRSLLRGGSSGGDVRVHVGAAGGGRRTQATKKKQKKQQTGSIAATRSKAGVSGCKILLLVLGTALGIGAILLSASIAASSRDGGGVVPLLLLILGLLLLLVAGGFGLAVLASLATEQCTKRPPRGTYNPSSQCTMCKAQLGHACATLSSHDRHARRGGGEDADEDTTLAPMPCPVVTGLCGHAFHLHCIASHLRTKHMLGHDVICPIGPFVWEWAKSYDKRLYQQYIGDKVKRAISNSEGSGRVRAFVSNSPAHRIAVARTSSSRRLSGGSTGSASSAAASSQGSARSSRRSGSGRRGVRLGRSASVDKLDVRGRSSGGGSTSARSVSPSSGSSRARRQGRPTSRGSSGRGRGSPLLSRSRSSGRGRGGSFGEGGGTNSNSSNSSRPRSNPRANAPTRAPPGKPLPSFGSASRLR